MAVTLEAFGIDRLSAADRRELARLILESVGDGPPGLSPAEVAAELDRRDAAADAVPGSEVPWPEAKARALGRVRP